MSQSKDKNKWNRRSFLKASGAAGAALGGAGLGFCGYQAGRDPESYTGWETHEGAQQTFNRKRFQTEKPHYRKTGTSLRVDARTEVVFYRSSLFMRQWNDETGLEGLDPVLQEYYRNHPEDLELDLYRLREIFPNRMRDSRKYGDKYILAEAWSNAMDAVSPPRIDQPPEISDFPPSRRGQRSEPVKLKSPEKTSRLLKKIAHELGSTLVGIARLNPDWVYKYPMRGRGFEPDQPLDVPKHWQFAVVVGTPMSWDPFFANPTYGTSSDAYSRSRIIAYRVASFIKQLGYAARPHTPGTDYDLVVPPILIDAGLGEQGRHGVVITPELGCNFRPAVITTNIPLKPDKPIQFGVQEFCRTCKICAENCPSGAIPAGGKQEVRGYLKYQINIGKCINFWYANLGNMGCRLCVATCPYSRKANWLHRAALHVSANDPTGTADKVLTGLQKRFYPAPDAQEYYMPSMGGSNASYREPPWWLKAEDFIDFQGDE